MTARLGLILLSTAVIVAAFVGAEPAHAMCGGNIFATCPPAPHAVSAEAARAKREKRLEAVKAKKRHYPLKTH